MKKLLIGLMLAGCTVCPRNTLRCNNNNVEICDGASWVTLQNCSEDSFVCCELTYGNESIESCAAQEVCEKHNGN